jgi:hypothetical protein
MPPVPTSISDLSTTASINSPQGTEALNTTDDYIRALSAIVKTQDSAKDAAIALKANAGANTDITSLGGITGLVDLSSATAGQIKFPATQNASTNANTLDDYEEGTWTPTGQDFSSSGSITYTGIYTKVGRVVHFTVLVDATNLTSTAGLSRITNMPFTATGTNTAALAVSAANATGSAIKTLGDALLTVTTSFASTTRITITGTYFAS